MKTTSYERDRIVERYEIRLSKDRPPIRFLYINEMHSTNRWRKMVDISACKINLFVEGVTSIIVNGQPYAATAGDLLLYRPHEQHYGNIPYQQNIEYFEFLFEPETFDVLYGGREFIRFFETMPDDGLPATLLRFPEDTVIALRKRFYRLRDILRHADGDAGMASTLPVLDLLEHIVSVRGTAHTFEEYSPYPAILSDALRHINQNFREELDNRMLGEYCHVSTAYLNRLFRRYLRCTPHDYILKCRLAQAKCLLDGGSSVTEACYSSGFRDCSSFGKVFKKEIGLTPTDYKKQGYSFPRDIPLL